MIGKARKPSVFLMIAVSFMPISVLAQEGGDDGSHPPHGITNYQLNRDEVVDVTENRSGSLFGGPGYISGNTRLSVKGFGTPEEDIVILLFATGNSVIEYLSNTDRDIFQSAKAAALNRSGSKSDLMDVCRRVIALNSDAFSSEVAESIASAFGDVVEKERARVLGIYRDMLESLSPISKELVEERKYFLHAASSSNIADFASESSADPIGFLTRRQADCNRL